MRLLSLAVLGLSVRSLAGSESAVDDEIWGVLEHTRHVQPSKPGGGAAVPWAVAPPARAEARPLCKLTCALAPAVICIVQNE